MHGLAWFKDAPKVEQLLSSDEDSGAITAVEEITSYVDGIISTINPAIAADGSDAASAPLPKTNPHVCNKAYTEVKDFKLDLVDLIATCQRHTRCSTAYCLKKKKGKLECRFGYPKPLQPATSIITEDGELKILTACNDSLLNSYNPMQLSAWRANVDMQYVVSRQRVIQYVAKYATKAEPRSKALKEVYRNIMKSIRWNLPASCAEAPDQQRCREGFFCTGNMSPASAVAHVPSITGLCHIELGRFT